MDTLKTILKKTLVFNEDKNDTDFFINHLNGNSIRIRMNDFPDEIMYSIFYKDETLDLDDLPDNWILQY
jgi:hypothetical protein